MKQRISSKRFSLLLLTFSFVNVSDAFCHVKTFIKNSNTLLQPPVSLPNASTPKHSVVPATKKAGSISLFMSTSSTTSKSSSSSAAKSGGVRFLVSQPSLNHLSCITGNFGKYTGSEWTTTKTLTTGGAIACGVVFYFVGNFIATNILQVGDESNEAISFTAATLGAGLGWVLAGGNQVSKDESRRADGGTYVKFIEDRPERLSHIVQTIQDFPALGSGGDGGGGMVLDVSSDGTYGLEQEATRLIHELHSPEYIQELQNAVDEARETEKPRRLRFEYARTMIDGGSYEAATCAVAQWLEATRMSCTSSSSGNEGPFVLPRPPSHHATKKRGMGGCLFASVAIAANYALDNLGASYVAILDIGAHHGNGIADLVQHETNIRYCSIHERVGRSGPTNDDVYNPRSPDRSDQGTIGNLLNVELDKGTTWGNGYESVLVKEAIPFLTQGRERIPDVLLVAAGFDALRADYTSSLELVPSNYERIGNILKEEFGDRIVFGLEVVILGRLGS